MMTSLVAQVGPMSFEDTVRGTVPYLIFFAVLFAVGLFLAPSRLKPAERAYWAASVNSLVHGVLVAPLSFHAAMTSTPPLWAQQDYRLATPQTAVPIFLFLGYLIVDTPGLFCEISRIGPKQCPSLAAPAFCLKISSVPAWQ